MSSAAKVGAFMLVILAILGYFVLKIEDISIGGPEQREIQVLFDNVAGLDERAAVRVAGVRKGSVRKIQLRPDGKALVTLQIDEDVPLFENATARIANLGLLGEKFVELDPGSPSGPELADGSTIPVTAYVAELEGAAAISSCVAYPDGTIVDTPPSPTHEVVSTRTAASSGDCSPTVISPRTRSRRGQALVEFAILLPLLAFAQPSSGSARLYWYARSWASATSIALVACAAVGPGSRRKWKTRAARHSANAIVEG